jgi:pSer/pThr/pTyr-binding forkhead associated (FHA) protein
MWILTLRHPGNKPQEYYLKEGKNTIGRHAENDIVVFDVSASRLHAQIAFDKTKKIATLQDLDSTNGTFLNRERLLKKVIIQDNDIIRIGGHTITVSSQIKKKNRATHRFTRELVLESLENHAVLMYEIAYQLNNVLDIESAITKVSALMRESMGADVGEVILADDFHRLADLGFPTAIAQSTIKNLEATIIPDLTTDSIWADNVSSAILNISSAMCVPVVSGEEIIALIYMYKTVRSSRPFNENDLRLAVAISHQTSFYKDFYLPKKLNLS